MWPRIFHTWSATISFQKLPYQNNIRGHKFGQTIFSVFLSGLEIEGKIRCPPARYPPRLAARYPPASCQMEEIVFRWKNFNRPSANRSLLGGWPEHIWRLGNGYPADRGSQIADRGFCLRLVQNDCPTLRPIR